MTYELGMVELMKLFAPVSSAEDLIYHAMDKLGTVYYTSDTGEYKYQAFRDAMESLNMANLMLRSTYVRS